MNTNDIVHDIFSCKQEQNMSECVKNNTADHETKVILGQGQIRPTVQVLSDACLPQESILTDYELGYETPKNGRDEVISGQGQVQLGKVHSHVFYNSKHTPSNIESLLVRPLCQNVNIFRANARNITAKSYADVVKNKVIESKSTKGCILGVKTQYKESTQCQKHEIKHYRQFKEF